MPMPSARAAAGLAIAATTIAWLLSVAIRHRWRGPLTHCERVAAFGASLYLVFRSLDDEGGRPERRLIAAGVLFACALYLKEVPLYLSLLLALALTFGSHGVSRSEGLRRAALYLLAIAAVVAPWTLRNLEVYGRVVPIGSSLGENFYGGVNVEYKNFDLRPFNRFLYFKGRPPEGRVRPWFVAIEPESGDYFLGKTHSEAMKAARRAHPDRLCHAMRVGHKAALHFGMHIR